MAWTTTELQVDALAIRRPSRAVKVSGSGGEVDVTIIDEHGEVVCWNSDEWHEDPNVRVSVLNAVAMALDARFEEMRELIGRPA